MCKNLRCDKYICFFGLTGFCLFLSAENIKMHAGLYIEFHNSFDFREIKIKLEQQSTN